MTSVDAQKLSYGESETPKPAALFQGPNSMDDIPEWAPQVLITSKTMAQKIKYHEIHLSCPPFIFNR